MKKLPIGIQNIQEVLQEGYTYVDKTKFVLQLMETGKHHFLSRPRRFGKSLFLSTLSEIFQGNKELFRECHIYNTDYQWQKHPVLYLNFALLDTLSTQGFKESLENSIQGIATKNGLKISAPSPQEALKQLIEELAQKEKVVILIDEYDKPIIDNLHKHQVADANREILKACFGVFKNLDQHIRFTFITGISRFSKVSLFSGANHLEDISMDPRYADLMGYTYQELCHNFKEHLQAIVEARGKTQKDVMEEVKEWYNGYRFTKEDTLVYNPFSTLLFLKNQTPKSYWYQSGTPTFLVQAIDQRPEEAVQLSQMKTTQSRLSDISNVQKILLPALMFQTGYLTITDYLEDIDAYQLDFPNQEVRIAFFDSILEELAELDTWIINQTAKKLHAALHSIDLMTTIDIIKAFLAKVPYQASNNAKEGFFQALFLTFLELSGIQTQGEVVTNKGRIDLVCNLNEIVYIWELKVDQDVKIAMEQIRRKEYAQQYTQHGKKIVLVGVSFSSTERNIADWCAESINEDGVAVQQLA